MKDNPQAVSPTGGEMTLTAEDLKQIKNTLISALTHSADVQAWIDQRVRQALADSGVLTAATLTPDTGSEPVRRQLENVAFAAVKEAVRLGIVAPGPNPRGN